MTAVAAPNPYVTGLVLAGGQGSRLGGIDKGWIEFAGTPLIERVIERLRPQVAAVMVSANRSLDRYAALPVRVLTDDPAHGAFAGPLAGILAALRTIDTPWLAIVPVDAPHAPSDFVARLWTAATGDVRAVVATCAGRVEPLFCLVHRDLAGSLQSFLDTGGRKVAAWLDREKAASVAFPSAADFANVNTPADLPAA